MFWKRRLLHLTLGFVVGALAFWFPIIGAFWVFGGDWGGIIASLLFTFFLPVFCCFVLEAMTRRWHRPRLGLAVAMVLGVWATGPVCMLVTGPREPGGGFHMAGAWSSVGQMTAIFPISTFMMATYYGCLFALLLTTIALPIFSITRWSFRPSSAILRCGTSLQ